jgi:hypothetical protein
MPIDFDQLGKQTVLRGSDTRGRRAILVLCLALIALGTADMVRFAMTDFAEVSTTVAEAQQELDNLPESADDVARREALDRRAAATANVTRGWLRLGGMVLGLGLLAGFAGCYGRRPLSRSETVDKSTLMLVLLGVLLLAGRLIFLKVNPHDAPWGLLDLFILHFIACAILPWTPREAAVPFGMLLLVWAATFLAVPSTEFVILDRMVGVIMSPVVLVPGSLMAAWRWRRGEEDAERLMLGEQVRTIGGELTRARIVNDAMFPTQFDSGHLRFEYHHEPIAEIGGDYVHLSRCDNSGRIYLTILDVAGHGLAAALTVNRLFGEIERIRAEDPDASPDLLMSLLNKYINLTMAAHSLYATGACIMLDPASGLLEWVNAGHPPALLRKATGQVVDLPGTTMLLGALEWDEFQGNPQRTVMEPGDVVIVYTDGAFEARNASGTRFGLDKIRETARFNPPPRDWSRFITNAVSDHQGANAEDDVLVATLHLRSLHVGQLQGEAVEQATAG